MCNKCDSPDKIVSVPHLKFLVDNEIDYFKVSAKTGKGV